MRGWTPRSRWIWMAPFVVVAACGDGETPVSVPDPTLTAPDGGGSSLPASSIDRCEQPGALELGDPCTTDNDCDDGCFCDGLEVCSDGACAPAEELPCPDGIACTQDVCFEELDRCFYEPRHAECSDEDACNGFERCSLDAGCEPGPRLFCNDESACTVDACDADVGCVFTRRDLDGDGFLDGRCGGEDCNDDPREGAEIFPGAPEICTNRLDDNCDGIRDYFDDACVPENDTCELGRTLDGPGLHSASTKGLVGDYQPSCGRAGPDAVFHFTVPTGYFPEADVDAVDVSIQASGPSNATLLLRDRLECADEGRDDVDIDCAEGRSPSMLVRSLPPGDYAIVVATPAPVTSFDLRLDFDPPTPLPAYDVCNAETEEITTSGTYEGLFEETDHDYQPSCGAGPFGGDRPDAAYKLVLAEASDVTLRASTTDGFGADTSYVALYRSSCSDLREEIGCVSGFPAEYEKRALPAGEYFIVIESFDVSPIRWSLNVDIRSPPAERLPGDACSTAPDITTSARTVGITDAFVGDTVPSCGFSSSFARDAIFEFTLSDLSDVELETTVACDPSTTFCWNFHYQTILSECDLFTTEVACRSGSNTPLATERRSVNAGTYYAVVWTTNASHVSAEATVDIGPPTPIPENDRCDGEIPEICDIPEPVFIDRTGTLVGFNDDISGTCAGTFASPVDALYKCTLATRSLLNVSATRRGSRATGGLFTSIREGGCPGSQVACTSAFRGSPVSVSTAATLDPGTYYVVVESRNTELGDFTLVAVDRP